MASLNFNNLFICSYKFTRHDTVPLSTKLGRLAGLKIPLERISDLSSKFSANIIDFQDKETIVYTNFDFRYTLMFFTSDNVCLLSKMFYYGPPRDILRHLDSPPIRSVEIRVSESLSLLTQLFCRAKFTTKMSGEFAPLIMQEFASGLYKLRHDIVVEAVFKCLTIPFKPEQRVQDVFPTLVNGKFNLKTPDIIIADERVDIYEITVTAKENEAEREKHLKYDELVTILREELKKPVELVVISVNPLMTSLTPTLSKVFPGTNDIFEISNEAIGLSSSLSLQIDCAKDFFMTDKKKLKNEAEHGRLLYYKNLEFELPDHAKEFEEQVSRAVESESHYNSVLEDIFENGQLKTVFPDYLKPHVPTHCDLKSIVNLITEIPAEITENYERLEFAAPSLHFVVPIEQCKYPDESIYPLSEEDLTLTLLDNIYLLGIASSEEPAFHFLADLAMRATKIRNNDTAHQIFKTGYPDQKFKNVCLQYKKSKVEEFLERRRKSKESLSESKYTIRVLGDEERDAHIQYREEMSRQKEIAKLEKKESEKVVHKDQEENKLGKAKKIRNPDSEILRFSRRRYLEGYCDKEITDIVCHHKCIKLNPSFLAAAAFLDDAHIGFDKTLRTKNVSHKAKSLIPSVHDHALTVQFLDQMSKPSLENHIPAPDYLFDSSKCPDNKTIKKFKVQIHDESNPLLKTLLKTQGAQYAYRCHLFSQQLIHFGSYKSRAKNFYFCNTGLENIGCCVAGVRHKPSTDPGVPFFFFGTVDSTYEFSPLFGKVFIHDSLQKEKKVFITNWRRLKLEKISHLRDVFFSTLATGFKNLSQLMKPIHQDIVEHFSIRILIGSTVSQKIAEFMADFKYISMATLSEFSKTDVLIKDKIKGPFTKHIESFVLFQLIKKSLLTIVSLSKNPIVINEFTDDPDDPQKTDLSVGGKISLPYLWAQDGFHHDFNNYLDSVHTYVHTIKEPASNFHENIKSMNTIIKFNEMYKKMSDDQRSGILNSNDEAKGLMSKTMGFSARFLSDAMKSFLSMSKIDFPKLLCSNIFFSPIAHFASTKASIADPQRQEDSTFRMKVIDAMLVDTIEATHGFSISNTLVEHSVLVLSNTSLKPITDMCIKVQYGPKREFYVLDVFFKFALKFLEEFFKQVCKQIPTECISIPGDLKLLKIQEINRKIRQVSSNRNTPQFYINGDCSKWSASELMESFGVMVFELKKFLPLSVYKIFITIISVWKHKRLQLDPRIFDKIEQTEFTTPLFDNGSIVRHMTLPQNFLMGLFNYLSSFKAVVVFEYIKTLINSKLPAVLFKHLEHSDDYTIGLVCKTNQIVGIKTFASACMRFGSITDSEKKTVISNWYQEFVSLFTFNGVMTYPQIKKVKEVTSAITGMGYYQDSSCIGSRVAEVMRCGCTNQTGLIFLKIHNWLLQEIYSLSEKHSNDLYRPAGISPFEVPVQAFGLSECWPMVYLLSDGDPNNFRVARYGGNHNLLLELSDKSKESFEQQIEGFLSVYSPNFLKTFTSDKLRKVKKMVKFDEKESIAFWENHASYKFIKPNYKPFLLPYLKSFYSLKSFTLAYTRMSKLATILRISSYVRRACIEFKEDAELYTIRELVMKFIEIHNGAKNRLYDTVDPRFLTEGSLVPILFDEILCHSYVKFYNRNPMNYRSVAAKLPKPYTQTTTDSDPAVLIQYHFNRPDFELDERIPAPGTNIQRDNEVLDAMEKNVLKMPPNEKINFMYAILTKDRKKTRVCISPSHQQNDLIKFSIDNLTHNLSAFTGCRLKITHEIKFDGPLGTTPLRFHFQGKGITRFHAICKTIITLATFIQLKTAPPLIPKKEILRIFDFLRLNDDNRTILEFIAACTNTQMIVNELTENECQSMLVLQGILLNIFSNLDVYSSQYASLLYRYDQSARFSAGKYTGNSVVSYSSFEANAKMIYSGNLDNCILVTNQRSISKAMMLYNVGLHFVQKKMATKWESEKILEKLVDNLIPKVKLQEALEEFLGVSLFTEARTSGWEILCYDNGGLLFRKLTRLLFTRQGAKILPVICNPNLLSGSLDDARKCLINTDYVVDLRKWNIKTRSGDWIVARFAAADLFTTNEVFHNSDQISFDGLRLSIILKDSQIRKVYWEKSVQFEDPRKLFEALEKEILPKLTEGKLRVLNAIKNKITKFDFNFPTAAKALKDMDFPELPNKGATGITQNENQDPASVQVIGKTMTKDEIATALTGIEIHESYVPVAQFEDKFKLHKERLKAGGKGFFTDFAKAIIEDEAVEQQEVNEYNKEFVDNDPDWADEIVEDFDYSDPPMPSFPSNDFSDEVVDDFILPTFIPTLTPTIAPTIFNPVNHPAQEIPLDYIEVDLKSVSEKYPESKITAFLPSLEDDLAQLTGDGGEVVNRTTWLPGQGVFKDSQAPLSDNIFGEPLVRPGSASSDGSEPLEIIGVEASASRHESAYALLSEKFDELVVNKGKSKELISMEKSQEKCIKDIQKFQPPVKSDDPDFDVAKYERSVKRALQFKTEAEEKLKGLVDKIHKERIRLNLPSIHPEQRELEKKLKGLLEIQERKQAVITSTQKKLKDCEEEYIDTYENKIRNLLAEIKQSDPEVQATKDRLLELKGPPKTKTSVVPEIQKSITRLEGLVTKLQNNLLTIPIAYAQTIRDEIANKENEIVSLVTLLSSEAEREEEENIDVEVLKTKLAKLTKQKDKMSDNLQGMTEELSELVDIPEEAETVEELKGEIKTVEDELTKIIVESRGIKRLIDIKEPPIVPLPVILRDQLLSFPGFELEKSILLTRVDPAQVRMGIALAEIYIDQNNLHDPLLFDDEPIRRLVEFSPLLVPLLFKGEPEDYVPTLEADEFESYKESQRLQTQLISTMSIVDCLPNNKIMLSPEPKVELDFIEIYKRKAREIEGIKEKMEILELAACKYVIRQILLLSEQWHNDILWQLIKTTYTKAVSQGVKNEDFLKTLMFLVETEFLKPSTIAYKKRERKTVQDKKIKEWQTSMAKIPNGIFKTYLQEWFLIQIEKESEKSQEPKLMEEEANKEEIDEKIKRYKFVVARIELLESDMKHFVKPTSREKVDELFAQNLNIEIAKENFEKDKEVNALLAEAHILDVETNPYRTSINPVIADSVSYMTAGLDFDFMELEVDKSAIKSNLSRLKLHSAFNMEPREQPITLKKYAYLINDSTNAWRDFSRCMTVISLQGMTSLKITLTLFVYLSLTRKSHLVELGDLEKIVWNNLGEYLENCQLTDNSEFFPERIGVAVTRKNQITEWWTYKVARQIASNIGAINLGMHSSLHFLSGRPLTERGQVEREIEYVISVITKSELSLATGLEIDSVVCDMLFKLCRHDPDLL